MALDASNKIINSDTGVVVDAKDVGGGYFVTESTAITTKGESGKIPDYACVDGALCYCTSDNKFYQCSGTGATATWAVATFNSYNNQTTTWQSVSFGANAAINIVQGANINITANATTNTATISVSGLATVATSGAYSDLINPPTLSDLGGVATTRQINNHSLSADITLTAADVGALPDSINVPDPANDGVLTIVSNGSTVATFSANSASDVTATIDVPTVYDWAKAETKPSYDLGEIDDTENYVKMTLAEKTKLGDLATVATTGSYSDLSDKPAIPTVNNATINIQVGGETQGSFSLNQSSGESINLPVATADEIRGLFDKYKEGNS